MDDLVGVEGLLVLAAIAGVGYLIYKIIPKSPTNPDGTPNTLYQAIQNAGTSLSTAAQSILPQGVSLSPNAPAGQTSGTTVGGASWTATSGSGSLDVNGMLFDKNAVVGPTGQTVGDLLGSGWSYSDIATMIDMSGTVPVQVGGGASGSY